MKKFISALFISLGVNLTGALVNYIYYRSNRHLLLCFRSFGGEITIENAFGLLAVHIYTMEPNGRDTLSIRFEPIVFVLWVFAGTLIVFTILFLIGKIRKK